MRCSSCTRFPLERDGEPVGCGGVRARRLRAAPHRERAPRLRRQRQPRAQDADRRARAARRDDGGDRRRPRRRSVLADQVVREADRLVRIVDDLLDLSLDRGAGGADARPRAGPRAARGGGRAGAGRGARARGAAAATTAPPPDVAVVCDPTKLRGAVTNLLDNAIKYSDAGRRGRGRRERVDGSGRDHRARPRHRDPDAATSSGSSSASTASTGPAAARPAAPGSASRSCATSRRCTAATSTVESREGEGSTFRLALPARRRPAP